MTTAQIERTPARRSMKPDPIRNAPPAKRADVLAKLARSNPAADPVDIHVGAEIRTRRKLAMLSQTQLANACGITFQQVQKYERGFNRVSASMLVRVADCLGCRPGDLFPEGAHKASSSPIAAFASTVAGRPNGTRTLQQLAAATDADYRSVAAVLEALTSLRGRRR